MIWLFYVTKEQEADLRLLTKNGQIRKDNVTI